MSAVKGSCSAVETSGERADLVVRRFRDQDLHRIYGIETDLFPTPWTPSAFLHLAYDGWGGCSEVHVLERRAQGARPRVIGYVCMMREHGLGHILNLAVDRAFQGQKLGEKLLQHALDRFIGKKLTVAVLEVRKSNERAFNLYQKHGFGVHHVEKNYYPDGEDGFVMVRNLRPE